MVQFKLDWTAILGIGALGIGAYAIYKFWKGDWKLPELKLPEIKLPELTFPTIPELGALPETSLIPFIETRQQDPAKTVIENMEGLIPSPEPIGKTQEQLIDWAKWLAQQTTPPIETTYVDLTYPFGIKIPIGEQVAPSYQPQPPPPLPPMMIPGVPTPATHIYNGTLAEYNKLPREVKQYYLPPAGNKK